MEHGKIIELFPKNQQPKRINHLHSLKVASIALAAGVAGISLAESFSHRPEHPKSEIARILEVGTITFAGVGLVIESSQLIMNLGSGVGDDSTRNHYFF